MKLTRKQLPYLTIVVAFGVFAGISFLADIPVGVKMGQTFGTTLMTMMKLLPCAFVLIALFDVWVKRETVERHCGRDSGAKAYVWAVLLASMTVGGLYVAFPLVYSLYRKSAKLGVLFAYIGLAGVCRIPMTIFEISFMGVTFTAVRLAVSVPLVIATSVAMGRILQRRSYEVTE